MKKNALKEDVLRIHELTYGKKILKEEKFLSKIFGDFEDKKEKTSNFDDPKKADIVTSDVDKFYQNIEDSISSGGLSQQKKGDMEFQKGVESMQIGLMLLGYDLPKQGVDGLFGPETAGAVSKFNDENVKDLNESTNDESKMTEATPKMLSKLSEMLKKKGVSSEELKKYIDPVTTGGGGNFTDLDLGTTEGYNAYVDICQKFIDSKQPNLLGITGVMLADGAKMVFNNRHKYLPPELALAQLAAEGGIGNKDPQSRPIKTKNPFNVGNVESGENVFHEDVQSGINAYYDLIGKDYLVKGKTAADLVKQFVNKNGYRYASETYEPFIDKLAGEANKIATPIYLAMSDKEKEV